MKPLEIASQLPNPAVLRQRCRNLAALEAIISPEWDSRYFSFDPRWASGETMASMRNGSGDNFFVVFTERGSVLRVFDHESELSPWLRDDGSITPGMLAGFPEELQHIITEPAFRTDGGPETDLTFCAWYSYHDDQWRVGSVTDDGGATYLLNELLDPTAASYMRFVQEYYELNPEQVSVDAVWAGETLDRHLVERINPGAPQSVLVEIKEMGYPVASA